MNKRKLVLAFIFDSSLQKVLLIHKNRPEWQKGKLNGIGGKLNPKERKEAGITREVHEETNLVISKWKYIGSLQNDKDLVYCFTTIYNNQLTDALTTTDEKIEWVAIDKLPLNVHPNLTWLIPLCIDILKNNTVEKVSVRYK